MKAPLKLPFTVHKQRSFLNVKIISYDRYDDDKSGKEDIPYTINFAFYECIAGIFASGDNTLRDNFNKLFKKKQEFENPFETIQE